ncbi:DUF2125 domain-containing protein [Aliiroseovarius sp. YM-037]|uniref:DUF2125 domain-containing protein n=1 Tax=Aliiroseovarius sp. YM-037 TaxID=3341728 RepID=UPI003A7FD297
MRRLTGLLIGLAVLWGGYWFIGSTAVEKGMTTWFSESTFDGLDVTYSELETRGFPNRFDTTITDIDLTHRQSGTHWTAPFFQLFALSYKPNHLIAVWPNEQTLDVAGQVFDITSDDLRGSLVLEPNTSLTLDRTALEAENLTVTPVGTAPWNVTRAFIATRQTPEAEASHDLSVALEELTLPPYLTAVLDPEGTLPPAISGLTVDATLDLTAPINRESLDVDLTRVTFRDATIRWGDLSLGVSGELEADALGFAEGSLTLNADNWREVFRILATANLVDPIWEGAIAPLAETDGNPDTLTTSLTFDRGVLYFGPLALGDAPRLN